MDSRSARPTPLPPPRSSPARPPTWHSRAETTARASALRRPMVALDALALQEYPLFFLLQRPRDARRVYVTRRAPGGKASLGSRCGLGARSLREGAVLRIRPRQELCEAPRKDNFRFPLLVAFRPRRGECRLLSGVCLRLLREGREEKGEETQREGSPDVQLNSQESEQWLPPQAY